MDIASTRRWLPVLLRFTSKGATKQSGRRPHRVNSRVPNHRALLRSGNAAGLLEELRLTMSALRVLAAALVSPPS